jgi:hypothetical protein
MDDLKKALRDFVATSNSGKYSDFNTLMSKFPELSGIDSKALKDFVATSNSGKYKSEGELLSKFPEFGFDKKKEESALFSREGGTLSATPGTGQVGLSGFTRSSRYDEVLPGAVEPQVQKETAQAPVIQTISKKQREEATKEFTPSNSLYSGVERLYGNLAGVIPTIYDMSADLQNDIADVFGADWLRTYYSEDVPMLKDMRAIQDKFYEHAEFYKERQREYDKNISESIANGNYNDAFQQLISGSLESLPDMALSAASGLGVLKSGLAVLGTTQAVNRYSEIKDNDNMSGLAKTSDAILTGMAEAVFEGLTGTAQSAKIFKEIIKKEGKEKASVVIKNGIKEFYETAAKKYPLLITPLGEGMSELGTQISQNIIAKYSGADPNRNIMEGASDAFLLGSFMGGGFGVLNASANQVASSKAKKQINESISKISEIDYILKKTQDIPEDVRSSLTALKENLEENVKKAISNVNSKFSNLNEDQQNEFLRIKRRLNEINQEIENSENETIKTALSIEAKELTNKIKNISDYAVQEQATSEVPAQPEATVGEEVAEGTPKAESEVATEEEVVVGSTIKWDVFGNEEIGDWTVKDKTTTRAGKDAVTLSKIYVEDNTTGKSYTKEYADKNGIKYDNERIVEHIVPIDELKSLQPQAGAEVVTEQGKEEVANIDTVVVTDEKVVPAGKRLFNEPNEETAQISKTYKEKEGIDASEGSKIEQVDTDRAMSIADAYEAMEDAPDNPEVQEAYNAMADETAKQHQAILDSGYEVEIWEGEGEPYANAQEMIDDVKNNKHMYIYSTEQGFGDSPITEEQRKQNKLLKDSGFKDKNGKTLLYNDLFRFVHDFFGHTERGNGFGAIGEENAWDVHSRMYSPKARRAMTTETRGQNSWVNFGPQVRNKDGKIIKKGEPGYLAAKDRQFAPQKMGLLPAEFSEISDEKTTKTTAETGQQQTVATEQGTPTTIEGTGLRENIKKSIAKVFKKFEVKSFKNAKEMAAYAKAKYNKETGDMDSARVFAGEQGVEILVNEELADDTALGHEVWHGLLLKAFGDNQKQFAAFRGAINKTLRENGYEDIADSLDEFTSEYTAEDEVPAEEYLAQLGGLMTSANIDLKNLTPAQKTLLEQIKDIINEFAIKLTGQPVFLKDATAENILDFMSTMSDMMAKGEDIGGFFESADKTTEVKSRSQKAAIEILDGPKFDNKLKEDVASYLNGLRDSEIPPNSSREQLMERFINNVYEEVGYYLFSKPDARSAGLTWYIEDMVEFENKVKVILPELSNEKQYKLFLSILAFTSSGTNPNQNLSYAYNLWNNSNDPKNFKFSKDWGDKKLSFVDKKGKAVASGVIVKETAKEYTVELVDSLGRPEVDSKGNKKYEKISKASMKPGYPKSTGYTNRGKIIVGQLEKLEKLYADLKSIDAVVEWLETPHPIAELRKYNEAVPDLNGKGPGKTNKKYDPSKNAEGERNGAFIFGEKIGSFYQNMIGIGETITMDLWWSRTWNRYMGTMINTTSGNKEIQEVPRSDRERNIMREAVKMVAEDLNLQVSELQAAIWYFEQELWTKSGNASPSYSYVTAIDELTEKLKVDEETRTKLRAAEADLTEAEKRRKNAAERAAAVVASKGGEIPKVKVTTRAQKAQPQTIPGYDRMIEETKKIAEKSKKRGVDAAQIAENVINYIQGSAVYERADDLQREQIIRDARKELGLREKSAPRVDRILGIKDKVSTEDKKNLMEVIKAQIKATKNLVKAQKEISKQINKEIRELKEKGKITTSQMIAALRRLSEVDLLNEESVSNFLDYVARVFKDAAYYERVTNINRKRRAARNSAATKIGIADGLSPLLQKIFSIDARTIPESVLDAYEELINMFADRSRVLQLSDIENVTKMATKVFEAVEGEVERAASLAEVLSNYDKMITDDNGNIEYAKTVDQMVDDGSISAEDGELMKKYKSMILEEAGLKKEKDVRSEEEIEEERQQLVEVVKAYTPVFFQLPTQDERDVAREIFRLIKTDAIDKMSNKDLKDLLKIIDNIERGFLPHSAQIMKERMNQINNGETLSEAVNNAKMLPVESRYAKIKALFGGSRILKAIERNPLFFIDELFGNFNTRPIFESIFQPISRAFSGYQSDINTINRKIQNAMDELSNSLGKNPNRMQFAKQKIMAYMLESEYQANPNSKEVRSAKDFLDATIKYAEETEQNSYSDKDIENLKKIRDQFFSGESVDLEAMFESLSPAEKKAVKTISDINNELSTKVAFTSTIIRGRKVGALNSYIHHNTLGEKSAADTATEVSMADVFNASMKPSTKAKSLIERTGAATPLVFDPFSSTTRGARQLLMDYYLTEPIRTARRTVKYAESKVQGKQKRILKAISGALEQALSNTLINTYHETTFVEDAVRYMEKTGYRAMLGSIPRAVAELTSNLSYVMLYDPASFNSGISKYRSVAMSEAGLSVMKNVKSQQTERLYPASKLSGRGLDKEVMSQASGIKAGKSQNDVINAMTVAYNYSGKQVKNFAEATADALIGSPDKAIMKPLWFGAFASEFKKATGQEVDYDKIASNNEAYLTEFKEAIDQASQHADETSVRVGASDNPFTGILKGANVANQSAMKQAFNKFNNFMSRFLIYEYTTARTGVYALMGTGKLPQKQGAAILGATMSRMIVYSLLSKELVNIMMGMLGFGDDEEEDKSFIQKVGQATGSALSGLILGRNFGNFTKAPINIGVEKANKEFLDFLREGDYDPYEDALQYTIIPKDERKQGDIMEYVKSFSGAFSPMIGTMQRTLQVAAKEPKTKAAQERRLRELSTRTPLEILGNTGYIPLYRDVRKIVMESLYEDMRKESKSSGGMKTTIDRKIK